MPEWQISVGYPVSYRWTTNLFPGASAPLASFLFPFPATPADGALMMKLGMDGVFVGSGIFKSTDPKRMAKAVVEAVENYEDYKIIGNVSSGLSGMQGMEIEKMPKEQRLQERGW